MDTTGNRSNSNKRSSVFLVRLWTDEGGEERASGAAVAPLDRWQGRIQHVITGEAHSFGDWTTLIEIFNRMLPAPGTAASDQSDTHEGRRA
jgi:hypothetical protein